AGYQGSGPADKPGNGPAGGTGPFQARGHPEGQEDRLARNGPFFKKGLPYLDEVVMRVIPDAGTQVLALENGEVDFLWDVPGPDLSRLRGDRRLEMVRTGYHPGGSNCIMTMSFNLDRPILKELRVRQ